MHCYAILIAYDGSSFAGWQVQHNGVSIQSVIEDALTQLCKQKIKVSGSGRTDAGVHAEGQVAHFKTPLQLDTFKTLRALNSLLPLDLRVLKLVSADPVFHARCSAKGKTYRYRLDLNTFSNPFERKIRTTVGPLPYLDEMKLAASHLIGRHNFKAFANDNANGAAAKNPFRTILAINFSLTEDGRLDIDWIGEGFLYKMVRNLVGCLLAVGRGKLKASDIPKLLASEDRRLAPPAAAAKGLTLVKVVYDPDPFSANGPSSGIEQNESNTTMCCF